MKAHCFKCERSFNFDAEEGPYNEATVFYSQGNYGSGVYDPMSSRERLKAYICDECMVRSQSLLIKVVEVERSHPKYDYSEWSLDS